jgi:hypothetical protein
MPRCSASKVDGTPCQAIVKESQQLCHAHDPARADQRRRAASKAGKSRTGGEISGIKARLRELAEDVVTDRITTAKGSVAAQILGVYLRACEQERKQREYDELKGEMVELREMLEQGQGSAGGRSWTG